MPLAPAGTDPNLVGDLGVAIGKSMPGQLHCGFLIKIDDGEAYFVHLAWHNSLQHSELPVDYLWSQVALDEINRQTIAAKLSLLCESPPQIPYGFSVSGDAFDSEGRFIPPPTGQGLTCATFVTSFMLGLGFKVLDFDGWPHRTEDAAWQGVIIGHLDRYCEREGINAAEHISKLRADVGAFRVRPSEAVVAAMSDNWPKHFDDIFEEAENITQSLLAVI